MATYGLNGDWLVSDPKDVVHHKQYDRDVWEETKCGRKIRGTWSRGLPIPGWNSDHICEKCFSSLNEYVIMTPEEFATEKHERFG